MRPCLDCNEPTYETRCRACEAHRQRLRNAKPERAQYAGGYQAFRKRLLKYATHCAKCGGVLVRSKTSPQGATYDHATNSVQCRSCNSSGRRNV